MPDSSRTSVADPSAVAAYKRVLQDVLYKRPSGTRQRVAEALGNKASFTSQIANPAYSVPIPARHVEAILELCHFSAAERAKFLEAYAWHSMVLVSGFEELRAPTLDIALPHIRSIERANGLWQAMEITATYDGALEAESLFDHFAAERRRDDSQARRERLIAVGGVVGGSILTFVLGHLNDVGRWTNGLAPHR